MDWSLLFFWIGVVLNLFGAWYAGRAYVQAHVKHGEGMLEPLVQRPLERARALARRLTGRQPEARVVHPASVDARATATMRARGSVGLRPDASIEEQVAWLVQRVDQLQTWAAEDAQAAREDVARTRADLTDYSRQSDERLTDLDETTRDIAAGTARLHSCAAWSSSRSARSSRPSPACPADLTGEDASHLPPLPGILTRNRATRHRSPPACCPAQK